MFSYNTIFKCNSELLSRFLFFIFLFVVGIYSFDEYGVSFDEESYRDNALIDYNFIKNIFFNYGSINFRETFNEYFLKAGKFSSFFYIIVFFTNDLVKDYNNIDLYKIAHLLNFSIFILACYCFFKIVLIRFKSKIYSYLAVLILFTTPRIFAESFFNNRDIYYLSINLINLYFVQKIFLKLNFKNILIYSLISALCINMRLFGLINFFLVFIFLLLELENKISIKKLIINLILIFFLTIFFLILISPYYWLDPFTNFIKYYFTDFIITGNIRITNLFLGNLYSSQNTIWYYYIVWIFFTIPIFFLSLYISGFFSKMIFFFQRLLKLIPNHNLWINKSEMFDLYITISLIIFLFGVSRFSPVNLDGWRHVYFLYPLMVINIFYLLDLLIKKYRFLYFICLIFLSFNIIFNFYWIKKNHPYQFVYFNSLNQIFTDKKFDLDYWGVTNYQAYKFVLNDSKFTKSSVGTVSYNNLLPNYSILKDDEKNLIYFNTPQENPDYLIDNYRLGYKVFKTNKSLFLHNYKVVYEIIVNGNVISTVYKKKK